MRAAAVVLALSLAACTGGGDGESAAAARPGVTGTLAAHWPAVTDTVGETVVVRTVGVTDEAAALRLVEELRVGDVDGAEDYQFADVGLVIPASGSGVYVWDRIRAELRQYDSTGAFVRRIGRYGSGPGEYRSANGLVQLRDGRLVLWDPENLRMSVYDSAGAAVGSWRYESTLGIRNPWGLLADTSDNVYADHWFRPAGIGRGTPTMNEGLAGYRVLGTDGALRDSLLPPSALPRATVIVATGEGGGGVVKGVPFAPQPSWTVSRFGYVVSGVGDRYAITLHRPGAPLRIEREVEPVPVDPDERANAEEIAIAELRQMDRSWRWSGPRIPDVKPFFSELRPAADGRLWVQRPVRGVPAAADEAPPEPALVPPIGGDGPPIPIPPRRWRDPVVFDLFEPDGRFVGTLAVPARAEVLHMRGDRAWGVVRDEMDMPTVVRWRIEPAGRR